MRIIDKLQDYYDYLHDPTDTLVFDRRNSYLLQKASIIRRIGTWDDDNHIFLLLQCGAHYWLFFVTASKWAKRDYNIPEIVDYDIEVLASWTDYDRDLKVLKLEQIGFNHMWQYSVFNYNYKTRKRILVEDNVRAHANDFKDAIIHKDYEVPHNFSSTSERTYNKKKNTYDYTRIETFPLLKACGIANLIDADTMYYAIDEYFSLMKTASETTTAEGTTNKDKIVNHGFDTKTSFRGK